MAARFSAGDSLQYVAVAKPIRPRLANVVWIGKTLPQGGGVSQTKPIRYAGCFSFFAARIPCPAASFSHI